jgi:hypothetical protein
VPPSPIPDWILFSPVLLIAFIIIAVIFVSMAASRAGRPIPRMVIKRPAFRPTLIQGGKPDAAVPGQTETAKLAG